VSLLTFVAVNGTPTLNAALPDNRSLIGRASVTVRILILNHLKHKLNQSRTGDLRIT